MKKQVLFYFSMMGLLLMGCVSKRATLKTFIDPAIQTASIKTVAVFQMRNTAFSPGETMDMDRTITQAFVQKNSSSKTIGTGESGKILNDANLVNEFSDFLGSFETSGIANTVTLNKINALGIDAILQGRMSEVSQEDGIKNGLTVIKQAKTTLTIRYTILSTNDGKILWEGTSNAVKAWDKKFAPPIYEVATMAQNKIISSIPKLGK